MESLGAALDQFFRTPLGILLLVVGVPIGFVAFLFCLAFAWAAAEMVGRFLLWSAGAWGACGGGCIVAGLAFQLDGYPAIGQLFYGVGLGLWIVGYVQKALEDTRPPFHSVWQPFVSGFWTGEESRSRRSNKKVRCEDPKYPSPASASQGHKVQQTATFTYYRSMAILVLEDTFYALASRFLWSAPGAGIMQGCRGWWLDTTPLQIAPGTVHGVWGSQQAVRPAPGEGIGEYESPASAWLDHEGRCWLVELRGYGVGWQSENGVVRFQLAVVQRILGYGTGDGIGRADATPVIACNGSVYPQGACPRHGLACEGPRVGTFTGDNVVFTERLMPWPGFYSSAPFLDVAYDHYGKLYTGRCRLCGVGLLAVSHAKDIRPLCTCNLEAIITKEGEQDDPRA